MKAGVLESNRRENSEKDFEGGFEHGGFSNRFLVRGEGIEKNLRVLNTERRLDVSCV